MNHQSFLNHAVKYGTILSPDFHYLEVMTEFGMFWCKYFFTPNGGFIIPDINAIMIMEAKDGGIMIDIGANIGRYSIPMSLKADKVFAFEPDPECLDLLAKNTARYPNIEFQPIAVGKKSGEAELFQCSVRKGNSSLLKDSTSKSDSSIKVQVVSLDDFCRNIPNITAIKIDVEGTEVDVIEGAQEVLKRHNPIIALETHEKIDCGYLSRMIHDLGYEIFSPSNAKVDAILPDKQFLLKKP